MDWGKASIAARANLHRKHHYKNNHDQGDDVHPPPSLEVPSHASAKAGLGRGRGHVSTFDHFRLAVTGHLGYNAPLFQVVLNLSSDTMYR